MDIKSKLLALKSSLFELFSKRIIPMRKSLKYYYVIEKCFYNLSFYYKQFPETPNDEFDIIQIDEDNITKKDKEITIDNVIDEIQFHIPPYTHEYQKKVDNIKLRLTYVKSLINSYPSSLAESKDVF